MDFLHSPFTVPDESELAKANRWVNVLAWLPVAPLVVALAVHLYFGRF